MAKETKTNSSETKKKAKEEVIIDAKGKVLGRLSVEIALTLQGKHKANYKANMDEELIVTIKNADKVKVTGKKETQKTYKRYSGYPGGLYTRTYEEIFKKDPTRVIYLAVYGMLPGNKLRSRRMKRLKFE